MRLAFLNRTNEQERLLRQLGSEEGTLVCVHGRRRCGKSRLLQEVLPAENTVYFLGDEREPALQREALARAMAGMVTGMEAVRYPDWASLLERWWREAPEGAVLALDEFAYLGKTSPEIPSILQRLIGQNRSRRLHLIVCGSSQRMMQGLVLDATAPLYGRAQEIIEVRPLGASWVGAGLGLSRSWEILEAYAIWGGVPRYWELAGQGGSMWERVEDLVLDPMGVLADEPRRLLLDDMRDTAQAASILALVGAGCGRMSEIAARLGKPATSLARPVQRLIELRLVRREIPFAASERSSKKTLYRIDDPFLSFWFRYVEPNRSRLEVGAIGPVKGDIGRTRSEGSGGQGPPAAVRRLVRAHHHGALCGRGALRQGGPGGGESCRRAAGMHIAA